MLEPVAPPRWTTPPPWPRRKISQRNPEMGRPGLLLFLSVAMVAGGGGSSPLAVRVASEYSFSLTISEKQDCLWYAVLHGNLGLLPAGVSRRQSPDPRSPEYYLLRKGRLRTRYALGMVMKTKGSSCFDWRLQPSQRPFAVSRARASVCFAGVPFVDVSSRLQRLQRSRRPLCQPLQPSIASPALNSIRFGSVSSPCSVRLTASPAYISIPFVSISSRQQRLQPSQCPCASVPFSSVSS